LSANIQSEQIQRRLEAIQMVADSRSFPFSAGDLLVNIDADQHEPRAKMRGKQITLSPYIETDSEFIKLFVHELAHFVDIYVLRERGSLPDPSLDFYKISWDSARIKHPGVTLRSFIS